VTGTRAGLRAASCGVPGGVAAWGLLVVLVSLGLDVVLRTSEAVFVTIKWFGVAYLVYLAVKFWRAPRDLPEEAPAAATMMRREFLTLMGNPKAYLVLTAFLPQFVDTGSPLMGQLLGLGGIYIGIEAMAALAWASLGALIGARALTPLRRRILNRVAAGLMGGAALVLARSHRAPA